MTSFGPGATRDRNVVMALTLVGVIIAVVVFAVGATGPVDYLLAFLAIIVGVSSVATNRYLWFGLVRGARRAAIAEYARANAPFMRAVCADASGEIKAMGSGWFILREQDIKLVCRSNASWGIGSLDYEREIPLDDIRDVAVTEQSWLEYSTLVLSLFSGEKIAFTLAPSNGSGMRGPRADEVHAMEHAIGEALGM